VAPDLAVLNPLGFPPPVSGRPIPPRLDTLDGKRVFLVDCRFDPAVAVFLEQLQEWFAARHAAVETEIVHWREDPFVTDHAVLRQIKESADAAILGVGI
jgi:hypothetical protein